MRSYNVPDTTAILVIGAIWMTGLAAISFYSATAGASPVSAFVLGGLFAGMAATMLALARRMSGSETLLVRKALVERQAKLNARHGDQAA